MSPQPFIDCLLPAPVVVGFAMEDSWVWCGSVTRGEDGRYHMFASRWPKALPFWAGYAVASEVVRAVADTPTEPYKFQEVVLPARGARFWDGRTTHNPTIWKSGDNYLLYYIGSTYDGVHWRLALDPKAYSRTVLWSDGSSATLGCLERPQLLIEDGVPTHLFCAAADGPGGFDRASHSWNQVIPLAAPTRRTARARE